MDMSGQLYALAALPMGKTSLLLIRYKAGWAAELVWTFWRREKFHASTSNQTLDCPAHSLGTVPVMLCVLFGSWSNYGVPQGVHSWHLSLHSGQDCSAACLCAKDVRNLESSYCHGSLQYDIAVVLSGFRSSSLWNHVIGQVVLKEQSIILQGQAVQVVFLDCLTVKVKTLNPTKCQEPLTKWHSVTSQRSSSLTYTFVRTSDFTVALLLYHSV
jgi:hypothetical protein